MSFGKFVGFATALLVLGGCESPTNSASTANGPPPTATAAERANAEKLGTVAVARGAKSGVRQKIGFAIMGVNPDCSTTGMPTMRVLSAPAHGQLAIEPGQDYPTFDKANVRSQCNNKLLGSMQIFYTSDLGYVGPDAATIAQVSSSGTLQTVDYRIAVIGADGPAADEVSLAPATTLNKGAPSGMRQKIGFHYYVDPDCSSPGAPIVRLVTPPANGALAFEQGREYPDFDKDNIRFECDRKLEPATDVFYTSNPGYIGSDTAVVEVIFANGTLKTVNYKITVR